MRQIIMAVGVVVMGSSILISSGALANEPVKYTCTLNNAERIIEVSYSGSNAVPCKVNYTKEGTTESLWNYESTEGQCEAKASEFTEKQKSWGWNCSQDTATSAQ